MTCRQCYQLCFEGDPQSIQKTERWKYVGEGRGSYDEQSRLTYVGLGKGNIDKELPRTSGGPNCYLCTTLLGVLMLVTLGLLFWLYLRAAHPPAHAELYDCFRSYETQFQLWDARHRDYCCDNFGRGCAHFAPSPPVPHRVPHRVPQHRAVVHHVIYRKPPSSFAFDCHSGYSNWYFGWSTHKKSWCCDHRGMGCPGTWHGSHHVHTHVMAHGVGHAKGRIYDCDAGFSRWMTGWSDSKKDWCCHHQSRGCVKFHCTGVDSSWAEAKRSWCCSNVQKGCPRTTLSPLKCKTPCTLKGQTSTCLERIQWVTKNTYSGKEAACNLAYSRVQVECDVCRGCSIQEAGCEVHAGKDPFDCNAALNNFFRAWSPEKKHWCCTKQGKGCEGSSPPSVDPGFGMIWKHVQVNGYWTWQTVHAAGGVHTKLPYDCHAGLNNWQSGWSGPKKSWCGSHQQLGCGGRIAGGAATDVQSGSWNHGGDHIVHHVVHHVYH